MAIADGVAGKIGKLAMQWESTTEKHNFKSFGMLFSLLVTTDRTLLAAPWLSFENAKGITMSITYHQLFC